MKSNQPEPIPPEFAAALAEVPLGRLASTVLYYPTIGSTNDIAAACVSASTAHEEEGHLEGLVVLADAQTAGRGRYGRVWESPAVRGLYVSVLLTPARAAADPARATMLTTLMAGVGIAEGIEQATGLHADLKWPNDLLVERRKLCGILAEAASVGGGAGALRHETVVLGFGINVASAAFPPELADRVASIESELGRPVDRAVILAHALSALSARYEDLLAGRFDAILHAWRRRAPFAAGARVGWTTPDGPRQGITAGVDDHGALLVRTGAGIERIVAGEVTWS